MTIPASRFPAPGFTLLELLVVVFIIGIMAAMFTLSVGVVGGDDRVMRQEAERFATLVGLALEDANFQTRELGIRIYPHSYEFSVLDIGNIRDEQDNRWTVIGDDALAPREVPDVYEFELDIEGRTVALESPEKVAAKKLYEPQLFLFSSGDVSDTFDVRIRRRDDGRTVTIAVEPDGETEITVDD